MISKNKWIEYLFKFAGSTSILIIILIFYFMFRSSIHFFQTMGLKDLLSTRWMPVSFQKESFGIIPLLTGSFVVTTLAIFLAIPFGVLGAVYISEIAHVKEREILKPMVELLAGIPSVVIGFFGLVVVAPIIKSVFHLQSGLNALTGGLVLGLMAIPTIMSISEDAIYSVPVSYKEASIALGATRLQTIFRVVFPAALPGIIAAVMLGIGRIIGETMAVMMVTGNAAVVSFSPFDSVRTMTATIAAEMGEVPFNSPHYYALFCVGVVLLIVTFILNLIASKVLKKYQAE